MRLKSSRVKSTEYDDEEHVVHVTFKNGVKYRYEDVPPAVFKRFTTSKSPGRFVTRVLDGYEHEQE